MVQLLYFSAGELDLVQAVSSQLGAGVCVTGVSESYLECLVLTAVCMVSVLQDAVSALLARTSAELLAVEQELAQEEEEELKPEEQRGPGGDW